jgi:hypothetical protein
MSRVHSSPILRSSGCSPIDGSWFSLGLSGGDPSEIPTILLLLSNLQNPAF